MATTLDDIRDKNGCNISSHKRWQEVDGIFQECRLEVQKMKNICDETDISFFRFFTSDLLKVTEFYKIEKVFEILQSRLYKNEFPHYAFLLEKRLERASQMFYFKKNIAKFLEKFFEGSLKKKLPLVAFNHVLSFLNAGNFRNFAKALNLKG